MSETTVFFTILSQNYAPQARCLLQSLREHYPDARHVICLVEESVDPTIFPPDQVEVVLAKDVVGPSFYEMAYKYSLIELNTAVKPFAMKWLLGESSSTVTYIDPDCFIYSPLEELFALHKDGANIVLTPHSTDPVEDDKAPGEVDFLRSGTFNLGFVSVRASEETRRFLEWWSDRLRDLCLFDPVAGLFVDQKWMDLAPSFFEGVSILRHPGYNLAYWNAFQRKIKRVRGGWQVDGVPLRFFHFSSLPTDDVSRIARHQDRLDGEKIGPFIAEFHSYLALMASNALKLGQEKNYSYSLWWQREPIESQALRTSLRRSSINATSLADFRNDAPIAELLMPAAELPVDEMFPIPRLLYEAWLNAPLVAREYPLFTAASRAKYYYWVLTEGYAPLQIDPSLLPWRELSTPVAAALGGRFAVPPIVWMLWLTDKKLRRATHFSNDFSYAQFILELQKQISTKKRPETVLPPAYLRSIVMGDEDDGISVAQYAIWCTRTDLQAAFDLDTVEGRRDFITWCAGPSIASECPWMAAVAIPDQQRTQAA